MEYTNSYTSRRMAILQGRQLNNTIFSLKIANFYDNILSLVVNLDGCGNSLASVNFGFTVLLKNMCQICIKTASYIV